MRYKSVNMAFQKVSAIGMGHLGVVGSITRNDLSMRERVKLLRFAFELKGLNFIDTAENYGNGLSEVLIGEALSYQNREDIYVATKVSPENLAYNDVIESCESSLRRLKTDYIDLYQIHWPSATIELEETFSAMNKLKDDGKIRAIGVSNFGANLYFLAKKYAKIDAVQFEFNAIDNMERTHINDYEQENLLMIGYSPLHLPHFCGKKMEVLKIMANKYDVEVQELLLNWVSSQSSNMIPIFKSDRINHIGENLDAADFSLTYDDKDILDTILASDYRIIMMKHIDVNEDGRENKKIYRTMQDALDNNLGLFPSPEDLAKWMKKSKYHNLKAVKVKDIGNHELKYILYEGRARFWAHVICAEGDMEKVVPVVIV